MTKHGQKGSTYRGRFLYQVTTHDEEKPKSGTKDLVFRFPQNPSPSVPERAYLLKIALYEGVELPEFDNLCIHVACGPFVTKSKVVKNNNSRAVWNQYMPDLYVKGPDNIDDIYDVVVHLATSDNNNDRICFKRFKAKDLMGSKSFEIERYLFEEDKSRDALDDEQFPGMLFARIKMYQGDPSDKFPKDIFKPQTDYKEYLLQVHLYIGRNLPPADDTGAADPFIIARCQGKKTKSSIKYETLNPGWFETLEMVVPVPPLGDPNVRASNHLVVSNSRYQSPCLRC